jgi:hypothetical protein
MTIERTELEWSYQPSGFFEAPYAPKSPDCTLHIDSGKAVATLRPPQNPVDATLEHRVRDYLQSIFLVRKLQIRREFYLDEHAMVHQYDAAGGIGVEIRVPTATMTMRALPPDITVTNPDGTVVSSTKADRIAEYTLTLDTVAPKVPKSRTLRRMLHSYAQSVTDPDDELVHLYEISEILKAHYGKKDKKDKKAQLVKGALGITDSEWDSPRNLANNPHILQGRHRGGKQLTQSRSATPSELDEARTLARTWIVAFARTL